MAGKDRKGQQSRTDPKERWSAYSIFQKLVAPLAKRLTERKRGRNISGNTGENESKVRNPEVIEPQKPENNEQSVIDPAIKFHENLVRMAMEAFIAEGWEPRLADPDDWGYDIELSKGEERVAVQVRSQKAKVYLPQLKQFESFLDHSTSRKFSRGFLISASGFANTVYAYLDSEGINNILLGTHDGKSLLWYPDERLSSDVFPREKKYVGVFTCKGGVGKTTVSAHLAGAFAVCGYHVVLVDLDRQGNLRKLMGDGIYLPHPRKRTGTTITVIDHTEWDSERDPETGIVICDCNPEFSQNPKDLMAKFDYCLIPTTLNPLGINKNAFTIRKTFQEIRAINDKAELFVLINSFNPREKRNQTLNTLLKKEFETLTRLDPKCHYIDPDDVAIRYSTQLLYWGYETIIEQCEPRLAFQSFGGKSLPRMDFLSLAEYLESHTDIERFKRENRNIRKPGLKV